MQSFTLAMRLPRGGGRGWIFQAATRLAAAAALYHRGTLSGVERLPRGPALLVGNHGLYGLDTPVFFYLLWQATGRLPFGLAERMMCKLPGFRSLLAQLHGVEGTRDNALRLLAGGEWVVCYPGGAREVFKGAGQRHRLAWDRSLGFLRVAAQAQVPVVPFAGAGVDDTFRVMLRFPGVAALLAGHEKYAVPLSVGLGPAPLPARFRFRIGAPLPPPAPDATLDELVEHRSAIRREVVRLLAEAEHG